MGTLFTLTPDILGVVQTALDDLITELGKECKLVYPPRWAACDNCVRRQIGNLTSTTWKHGGPLPFQNGGVCPLCNGEGRKAVEQSEAITLLCSYEPRGFFQPVPGTDVRVANATLRTKCYLEQVPKLKKADHLIFQLPQEPFVRAKFELATEPVDTSNVVKGRYAVAFWRQIFA